MCCFSAAGAQGGIGGGVNREQGERRKGRGGL